MRKLRLRKRNIACSLSLKEPSSKSSDVSLKPMVTTKPIKVKLVAIRGYLGNKKEGNGRQQLIWSEKWKRGEVGGWGGKQKEVS